jgi:hypothetical protein
MRKFAAALLGIVALFSGNESGVLAAENEHHGIYRDSGDVSEKLPQFYCKEKADALREQYKADQETLRQIQKYIADHAAAIAERPYWGLQLHGEELVAKAQLEKDRAQWAQLKSRCPDIGQLDPEKTDPDPVPPDPKNRTGAGHGNLHDEAERLQQDYEDAKERAREREFNCGQCARAIKDGTVAFTTPYISDPAGYYAANCGASLDILKYQAAAAKAEAQARQKLANDPPRDDFKAIATVSAKQIPKPASKKESDRWLWEGINASQKVAANIDAYRISYERYQGAEKAGDKAAMRNQAKAMVRFAIAAEEASIIAMERRQRVEASTPPPTFEVPFTAEQKDAVLKRFRVEQDSLAKEGLPAGERQAMKDAGMTDEEIQGAEAEMKKRSPEERLEKFEQRIAREKLRSELAAQEKGAPKKPSRRAPPADLLEMELYARGLFDAMTKPTASPSP